MKQIPGFVASCKLIEGKRYFLRLSPKKASILLFTRVKLLGFTACPAIVIVEDDRGSQQRCSRDDLFRFEFY